MKTEIGNSLALDFTSNMNTKNFESVEALERWLDDDPGEVSRHILRTWRHVLENEIDEHEIVQCDEVVVTAKLDQAEEGIQALKKDAINREDYELAHQIKELQEEFGFDAEL